MTVHENLLKQLNFIELSDPVRLSLVGVAEQALFWKDFRQVLFSGARFRVLGRVAQDGLQNTWTPMKLGEVLDSVVPGFSDIMESMETNILSSMAKIEIKKSVRNTEQKRIRMRQALVNYARLLSEHYECEISLEDLSEVEMRAESFSGSFENLKERRKAFDAVAIVLLERFGIEREPLIIANYREVALRDADFDLSGELVSLPKLSDLAQSPISIERFLETELVAIYW